MRRIMAIAFAIGAPPALAADAPANDAVDLRAFADAFDAFDAFDAAQIAPESE